MPTISIIICTYNRSYLLPQIIKSIFNNKVSNSLFEVIIVDNNSSDDTAKMTYGLINKYKNIKYIKEERIGLSNARNTGIENAKGDILVFLDDDVQINDKYITTIIEAFNKYPNIVCAAGCINPIWENNKPDWFTNDFYTMITGGTRYGENFRELTMKESPIGANMIFKNEIFKKVGMFDCNLGLKGDEIILGEEVDLCSRIRQQGFKIYYIPGAIAYHKVHQYKVDKKYILQRYKNNGKCLAMSHIKNYKGIRLWFNYFGRIFLLIARDYPLYFVYKMNGNSFGKLCNVQYKKEYINTFKKLIDETVE